MQTGGQRRLFALADHLTGPSLWYPIDFGIYVGDHLLHLGASTVRSSLTDRVASVPESSSQNWQSPPQYRPVFEATLQITAIGMWVSLALLETILSLLEKVCRELLPADGVFRLTRTHA